MKTKLRLSIALLGLAAALPCQATEIAINDFIKTPDGSTTKFIQATDVQALNGGDKLLLFANGTEVIYVVSTFTFGTASDVHFDAGFSNSAAPTSVNRLGVRLQDTGEVEWLGTGDGSKTSFNFAQDMAGETVTIVMKLDYDVNRNTSNDDDTLGNIWINPTISSDEGVGLGRDAGDMSTIWNSRDFAGFVQAIDNQSTPGTSGDSSITDTVILTGSNATWADALVAAGITPPAAGPVNAGTSTVSASPVSILADGTQTSTITVTLKDSGGITVAGKTVTLANTAGPGTPSISPASVVTNILGKATFTVSSNDVGTEEFTATGDSVPITQKASVNFTSTVADGANSTVVASPVSDVPANGGDTSTITVTLKNNAGLPLPGKTVSLANTAGPQAADIIIVSDTTNASGVATFQVRSSTVGTEEFTATCDTDSVTLAGDTVSVGFITPGTATITWGTPADITDDVTNVSTNGTLHDARTGGLTRTATVNGVTFESVADSGNLFTSLFKIDTVNNSFNSGITDAAYRNLLVDGQRSANSSSPNPWTQISFTGLTSGHTYEIQFWVSDNRNTADDRATVLGNGDGLSPDPANSSHAKVLWESSTGLPNTGQYVIGTFVANANNQAFNVRTWNSLLTTPAAQSSLHFGNAWQIRDLGVVSGSPFGTWADNGTLGPVTFDGDTNGDGVQDGLAFLLGAANPDDNATGLLPKSSVDGSGNLVMTFTMLDSASRGTAALSVQHSGDLGITDAWAPVAPDPLALVPDTTSTVGGVSFAVSGSGTLSVVATIPSSGNASGGKLFGRLQATE